jgi:hypothetical protein
MSMNMTMTRAAALSAVLVTMVFTGRGVEARQSAQDLAVKLSGTWVFNRELSSGFGAAGRGGRGPQPAARFAIAPGFQGRGGGGGGASDASDLTPEQRAEQAAMRQLQQMDARITIKASAAEITFTDTRGERTYVINEKTSEIAVAGSPVKVKSKWDKQVLKQEFANPAAKLVQTWSVDGSDRLVLIAKVESLKLVTPERRAVFDRQ